MREKAFFKMSLWITGIVTIAIWSLLAWDHYHGGVPRHHLLHRADLPAISNWWGGLLLPILTWFLLYRIQKRLVLENVEKPKAPTYDANIIYRFNGALFFGILLSVLFTLDYAAILEYMIAGLFLVALFFPIYRAECLLGFVIGMTFTFGAVLPAAVGMILVVVAAGLYLYVRPIIRYILARFARARPPNKPRPTH